MGEKISLIFEPEQREIENSLMFGPKAAGFFLQQGGQYCGLIHISYSYSLERIV